MKSIATLGAVLLLALAGLAACGDDEATADCSGDEERDLNPVTDTLEVSAPKDNSYAFEQECLEATPGTITATFENPADISHDFCIEDSGGEELGCTELIVEGNAETRQYELEEGAYTFYCSVAGHREGGMVGELTVTESAEEPEPREAE